jgi:hypothetical protein
MAAKDTTTLSAIFQISIPKAIRTARHWKAGYRDAYAGNDPASFAQQQNPPVDLIQPAFQRGDGCPMWLQPHLIRRHQPVRPNRGVPRRFRCGKPIPFVVVQGG